MIIGVVRSVAGFEPEKIENESAKRVLGMKTKYILLSVVIVLAVALCWVGRSVYRAHKNIVTIDVYQVPLTSVIKQFERQTRETIIADNGLDAKVTLAVKNKPLDEALDQLARSAGANWSKWYAVHGSERALTQLETALRDRSKIEEAGWTNIAPNDIAGGPEWHSGPGAAPEAAGNFKTSDGQGSVVVTKRKPVMIHLDSKNVKDGNVEAAISEQLKASGADEATIAQAVAAAPQTTVDVGVQAGSGGGSNVVIKTRAPQDRIRMVTRSRDGSGGVIEEVWTPERVVLEQRLQSKLGDQSYPDASEAVAREVADKVKGSLTTLYVLRGSPGGFPFAGKQMRQIRHGLDGGTNAASGEPPPLPDMESVVRRAEAENYTRLTPEQRVERAREKKAAITNP
jgi:hypothetical protein